jgi:hypothetical protein
MRQIRYSQKLQGQLTTVGPGLADVELVGAGQTPLGTVIRLASQLSFADQRTFREEGRIELGDGGSLRITTLGSGDLADSPASGVRHGTAVLEAEGLGALEGAHGRITSNFVVSSDGEVVDDQVVVLFIEGEE